MSWLRTRFDLAALADYLFRAGALPDGWGCHVIGIPTCPFGLRQRLQ